MSKTIKYEWMKMEPTSTPAVRNRLNATMLDMGIRSEFKYDDKVWRRKAIYVQGTSVQDMAARMRRDENVEGVRIISGVLHFMYKGVLYSSHRQNDKLVIIDTVCGSILTDVYFKK